MSLNYQCPHCKGFIAMNDCLLFAVKTKDAKMGLISLHPEIGNYSVDTNSEFSYQEGEELEFFCPICHTRLASGRHKKLAKIIMIDENDNAFEILFSQIAGEKSTYKIIGETMEIYGDDSAEYIDFVNLSLNF